MGVQSSVCFVEPPARGSSRQSGAIALGEASAELCIGVGRAIDASSGVLRLLSLGVELLSEDAEDAFAAAVAAASQSTCCRGTAACGQPSLAAYIPAGGCPDDAAEATPPADCWTPAGVKSRPYTEARVYQLRW